MKKKRQQDTAGQQERWIDQELGECRFQDERHAQGLRKLLGQLAQNIGATISLTTR
jgi:hypothetical protein